MASEPGATNEVEGIDYSHVTEWFVGHVPGAAPPLAFQLIAGGRSNLTYRVGDSSGRAWALRRPPLSHVLPTAHDMAREFRVLSALAPTAVPVPRTVGLCTDAEVNGQPFYVMEFVDGHILRDAASAEVLDEAARARAGESIAQTLAALHQVDVDHVGLADFAKRDGYIERQLRRWFGQFESSSVDDGIDTTPVVTSVHDRLASSIPAQQGTGIVHGDYRLDNTVLGDDGAVRAVLDWEICTLGDPLADLGLLMVYWTEPGDKPSIVGVSPTTLRGFPSRAEVRDRYAELSGRDVSELDYYVAFGYWKLACILQGVYARYVGGARAGDRSSVEGFASSVIELAERAASVLESR